MANGSCQFTLHPVSGLDGKARPASGHGRPWQAMAGVVAGSEGSRSPGCQLWCCSAVPQPAVPQNPSCTWHLDCAEELRAQQPRHARACARLALTVSDKVGWLSFNPPPPACRLSYQINHNHAHSTHALSQIKLGQSHACRTKRPRVPGQTEHVEDRDLSVLPQVHNS